MNAAHKKNFMQKKKIIDYLEQLGLTDLEAKIYATLLRTGPISIRDLADLVGIKRTRTYLHIDSLVAKGLLIKIVKGTRQQVALSQPEDTLQQLVDEKIKTTEKVQTELPDILKIINESAMMSQNMYGVEIRYYKGKQGIKKIYEEALSAKELRSYVNLEILREALPENENVFLDALKNNKNIKIFEIFESSTKIKEDLIKEFTLFENKFFYKFLPQGVKLSAVDILIYDEKVAIISVKQQLTGVVLQNSEYYINSKELFDLIWKILP